MTSRENGLHVIITQFMLTDDEATVPGAFEVYDEVARTFTAEELPYVGFKNTGHPPSALRRLGRRIVGDGRKLVIEVAGGHESAEREAAGLAVELGAALLIGGVHTTTVREILRGTGIGYYPAVGDLTTEPGRLHGTVDGIVRQAREVGALPDVNGVALHGYRYAGDPDALLHAIAQVDGLRVVNVGSVDSAQRIEELRINEFWAFTIGGAVLDHTLPAGRTLAQQLRWVLAVTH
ncbi:hypothetical protein [Streptomyces capillispiralis]|uniref:hypothetical protein n=1 Tax=Streptomyces capillispiralis TaxID=68182 RepID=UPI001E4895AF|nr:hypothetical protein [Streptomyces capillispiralis]